MSQTHNHSVLKRMRLRDVLRLRQALLTRDLKAFEATATDKVCSALRTAVVWDTAHFGRRTFARMKAVKFHGAKRRRRLQLWLRRCEALKAEVLSGILTRRELVTPPANEMRKWWSDAGALVRVTDAEERGESLFRRLRAG